MQNEKQKQLYNPKVLLCIRPTQPKTQAFELIGHNNIYVKRTFRKRMGHLLEFNSVHTNYCNRDFYTSLQNTFLMEEIFSGVSHTFLVTGKPVSGKSHCMLGRRADPGAVLHFANHLFEEANSSYRFNTHIHASFFQYLNGSFKDLLAIEDIEMPLHSNPQYLERLTEVKVEDVSDFMKYMRVALCSQITRKNEGKAILIIKIVVTSFDQFRNEYFESIIHFLQYQPQISVSAGSKIAPTYLPQLLIPDLTQASDPLSVYLQPYTLSNCKLYTIYCVSDNPTEFETEVEPIKKVLQLRKLQVYYYENVKNEVCKAYEEELDQLNGRCSRVMEVKAEKLNQVAREYFAEMRKFFDWLEQTVNCYECSMLERISLLKEYREASKKITEQRWNLQNACIKREDVEDFWVYPLARLYGFGANCAYKQIVLSIDDFESNNHENFTSVKNLIKMAKQSKDLCGSVLEDIANLTDTWNRVLLREGRNEILEKFVNKDYFQELITWLRNAIRSLRKLTFVLPEGEVRQSALQAQYPRLSQIQNINQANRKQSSRFDHKKKRSEGALQSSLVSVHKKKSQGSLQSSLLQYPKANKENQRAFSLSKGHSPIKNIPKTPTINPVVATPRRMNSSLALSREQREYLRLPRMRRLACQASSLSNSADKQF